MQKKAAYICASHVMHVFLILTEEHACSVRNVRKAKKLQRNEQEKPDLSKINRVNTTYTKDERTYSSPKA